MPKIKSYRRSLIFSFSKVYNFKWKIGRRVKQFNFYLFSIIWMTEGFTDFVNYLFDKKSKDEADKIMKYQSYRNFCEWAIKNHRSLLNDADIPYEDIQNIRNEFNYAERF